MNILSTVNFQSTLHRTPKTNNVEPQTFNTLTFNLKPSTFNFQPEPFTIT
ncbi:MAG: hypothetical protein F6K26_30115 [Moorea sp. SIO2I5]|nr:hypothetical protein [Moorena sp. SIO2I5]